MYLAAFYMSVSRRGEVDLEKLVGSRGGMADGNLLRLVTQTKVTALILGASRFLALPWKPRVRSAGLARSRTKIQFPNPDDPKKLTAKDSTLLSPRQRGQAENATRSRGHTVHVKRASNQGCIW